ncbi:hypothetical protein AVEN_159178-1 [Araneus ventricosus]|uniref:Uncharacterized protein n=1 Tax=Araneus ventricosus TaxID=182803 RepID=A0A4Y2N445_ARAVE|nr:hypothetical protein AVEN_256202-1 [Araneus ventricosus]GBN34198.1 hypothetical protein AVEN_113861-1 [Araneus ventricosus]GBN34204.1 hypothetical protein AVEN_130290-1 [Araneus ventricosus]GBN34217.1 hypothetical protein AVEN_159178-1 [Araneus ventricosus]
MAPRAVDGDLMLEDKVKFFKEKLNGSHDIFRRVSEKKSTNAHDKAEFSNYKANILMLNVESVSSLVPEKNFESEETSSMMDLFIELKNEFATFRKDIYSKVDSFSKLICPTDVSIQNDDPRPSLHQEIIETELNSESSTYASVAQTSSAIPDGKFKVLGPVIKDKRVNPKVVINGARKDSGLKIVGKMPRRKAIFLSRLGPDTTLSVNGVFSVVCFSLNKLSVSLSSDNELSVSIDSDCGEEHGVLGFTWASVLSELPKWVLEATAFSLD